MTLTAMRPLAGRGNGRETAELTYGVVVGEAKVLAGGHTRYFDNDAVALAVEIDRLISG